MNTTTGKAERAAHGALDYGELERLGLHPEEVLDFSVNANPYGPSPRVREVVARVALDRYPDRECRQLRQTILATDLSTTQVSPQSIVCGNGAAELIWAIARAYLKPGLKAAIIGPTFGEYRVACLATEASVIEFRAQMTDDFQLDTAAVSTWIMTEQPVLVWLCNPNNPTGIWLDRQPLLHVMDACQRAGATLVVDESYWRFVFPHASYSAIEFVGPTRGSALIVLRSLTKDYALAGLRLGYAVADPQVVELLQAQLPSWNVNGVAQVAGSAALSDSTHLKTTLEKLASERQKFFSALANNGLHVIPSRTHFCLVDVGNAYSVRQQLLTRKMLVRDCASFGLPQYIRVATRPQSEWQQLLTALREII